MAVTYDGSVARQFVDGVETSSIAAKVTFKPDTTDLTIGGNVDDGTGVAIHNFHGGIDEVLLYRRALSALEIARLASGQRPR